MDAPVKRGSAFYSGLRVDVLHDDLDMLRGKLIYYSAHLDLLIVVPRGFATDYASVPRAPGAYWLAGGKAKWESVIHDYLCKHPEICSRADADRVFVEAMGVGAQNKYPQPAWRRQLMGGSVHAYRWWNQFKHALGFNPWRTPS